VISIGEGGTTPARVVRSFVDVPAGTIHVAQAGAGDPVLLLHQTPRSWDEYRDVLPLLGEQMRAIAIDTIGYGDSSPPPWPPSIERWAEVSVSVLDALGIERASVVGHHTGAVIAVELAAAHGDRVDRLVLSAPAVVDEEHRRLYGTTPPVDHVERTHHGSHVVELWSMRAPYYPRDIDLLERFLIDALKAGDRSGEGHLVVARYEMLPRLPLVRAPVLIVAPTEDPFGHPDALKLAGLLPGSRVVELHGGTIPAPDHLPDEFAAIVTEFLTAPA
jgi:pimeloyl-ACP methyl ester carboxylesterase